MKKNNNTLFIILSIIALLICLNIFPEGLFPHNVKAKGDLSLTIILLWGTIMFLISCSKKYKELERLTTEEEIKMDRFKQAMDIEEEQGDEKGEETFDDEMVEKYIAEVNHTENDAFIQYDVLLNIPGYGWQQMLDMADDVVMEMDIIDRVTTTSMPGATDSTQYKDSFEKYKSINKIPELEVEQATLGVAGHNKDIGYLKIVWVNQMRFVRVIIPKHINHIRELEVKRFVAKIFSKYWN